MINRLCHDSLYHQKRFMTHMLHNRRLRDTQIVSSETIHDMTFIHSFIHNIHDIVSSETVRDSEIVS
jgi:hypothetical protein